MYKKDEYICLYVQYACSSLFDEEEEEEENKTQE